MRSAAFFLLVIALAAGAAERTVLLEEVVNCGCGFCWMEEEALQTFVSQAFSFGNLAVVRIHCDYPNPYDPIYIANPIEQEVRIARYAVSTQPFIVFDGVVQPVEGDLEAAFAERLLVPSIIDIQVARQGTGSAGSLSIRIIAEEEPQWYCPMMVWPILVEDGIPGVGYWSYSQFDQAFRDNLLGYFGQQISFQGPFPDTIYVDAPYQIDPSWDTGQLYLATFVQSSYQSIDDEVHNTSWEKFTDIPMGLPGEGSNKPSLTVTPNPSQGYFQIRTSLPEFSEGTLGVFDLSGRLLFESNEINEAGFTPEESGIYIVTLIIRDYPPVSRRVTILR